MAPSWTKPRRRQDRRISRPEPGSSLRTQSLIALRRIRWNRSHRSNIRRISNGCCASQFIEPGDDLRVQEGEADEPILEVVGIRLDADDDERRSSTPSETRDRYRRDRAAARDGSSPRGTPKPTQNTSRRTALPRCGAPPGSRSGTRLGPTGHGLRGRAMRAPMRG